MSKCIVTGSSGYIGSHLTKKLKTLGHEVFEVDKESANTPLDLAKELTYKYLPTDPDYIFHLACIPRVAYSVEQPVLTTYNNVLSTTYLLDYAKRVGCKRLIYAGSSSVVGNGDGPSSPYGLQKLVSEMECKLYSSLYNLDTVTLRYFNVYSEDQVPTSAYSTAICNWMECIRTGSTPYITGNGEQNRDMAYVHDVVDANIAAMEYENKFNGQHFDIGTGSNITLNEIKDIVQKYHDIKFDYVEDRKGDVFSTVADIEPFKKCGWSPKVDLHTGINRCFSQDSLNDK